MTATNLDTVFHLVFRVALVKMPGGNAAGLDFAGLINYRLALAENFANRLVRGELLNFIRSPLEAPDTVGPAHCSDVGQTLFLCVEGFLNFYQAQAVSLAHELKE